MQFEEASEKLAKYKKTINWEAKFWVVFQAA